MTTKNLQKKYPVVVQDWLESESGWGQRPDGISVHLTKEDSELYSKKYWDDEKKRNPSGYVPECYSREDGSPYVKDVSAKLYRKLKALKKKNVHGIRFWSSSELSNY